MEFRETFMESSRFEVHRVIPERYILAELMSSSLMCCGHHDALHKSVLHLHTTYLRRNRAESRS